MGLWYSISGILFLILFVVIGTEGIGLYSFFAIFIPYVAVLLFIIGFIYRVLKWGSSPVPFQVEPGTTEYVEARRLLTFLEWFHPCDVTFVPEDSILREFIGGSVLTDFVPHL